MSLKADILWIGISWVVALLVLEWWERKQAITIYVSDISKEFGAFLNTASGRFEEWAAEQERTRWDSPDG